MSEEQKGISVYDLMAVSLDQFVEVAWVKMGLRADPLTRTESIDMSEAKVAIDVASRFAETLDPHLEDEDRRRVQSLLSDLRLNYIRKSG
ncbi:MAG: DUF1844 domain-containing protein [Armatimonadota bacterium]|nr:DUF1844 domain-containing protein [Armatimonadota bacterium]